MLSLAEEGVTPAEMEEFIHPGISVDMMEKIRRMKKRTETRTWRKAKWIRTENLNI